jgi:hypothetical protein
MDNILNKEIKIFKINGRLLRIPTKGTVEQIREVVGDDYSDYYLFGSWGSSAISLDNDEFVILD